MGTPTEIIYARVPVDKRIGERIEKYRNEGDWPTWRRPSIGTVVAEILDKHLPPIAPAPKATTKKPAKKARRK